MRKPSLFAETFSFEDENGASLGDIARLDTMVTLVDAHNFKADLLSQDSLEERGEVAGEDDERSVADLLIDQIEFADVLVLNKTDGLTGAQIGELEALLRRLNAGARIVCSEFGRVDLSAILNTGLFEMENAAQNPGWMQEARGSHVPETLEYGIGSFVFRAASVSSGAFVGAIARRLVGRFALERLFLDRIAA